MDILIIRLSALGDIIHCIPAVVHLKKTIPGARITWLVEPAGAPLLVNNPAVDDVVVLPRKQWISQLRNPFRWGATASDITQFWSALRSRKFDAAINFQGLLKSAVCASASGAKIKLGFKGSREGSDWFMTELLDVGDYFAHHTHVVDLNLRLAHHLCYRLGHATTKDIDPARDTSFTLPAVPDSMVANMNALINADSEMASQPVAALIPGTTWPTKIWPLDRWKALGVSLLEKGYRILVLGGPSEKLDNARLVQSIQNAHPGASILDLTGKTSLLELIALFENCQLVVGGDTGPLHLADAVGIPSVVAVHGSTPVGRNKPYRGKTVSLELSCQPCFESTCPLGTTACLHDLDADTVLSALPAP